LPARRFPWGDEPFERSDLQGETTGSAYANYNQLFNTTYGTLPVGSFPLGMSPYGLYDMLGNAAEWTWDWFDFDYYASAPTADPLGSADEYPGLEDWKSVRGGSAFGTYIGGLGAFSVEHSIGFRSYADWMRYRAPDTGFRLARTSLTATPSLASP
jgi:formylglycine-generating enzyme required for sulfatase activity